MMLSTDDAVSKGAAKTPAQTKYLDAEAVWFAETSLGFISDDLL